ncbi:MAG: hypothetical protein JXR48_17570 [Candidatus Delongbacteria bacterium]|nr:hypothetical protein [Candidatus Delongbacteria bacterium]MBN2836767.1 hypothetical protein [Candidatus Delongbacteria bacterium]
MRYLNLILIFLFCSCSYYSFSGASVPSHIKTVQVVKLDNLTSRYDLDLSDVLTEKLIEQIESYNLMDVENDKDADSKISGKIKTFSDDVSTKKDDDNVEKRIIRITIEFTFYDNINDVMIIKDKKISLSKEYEEKSGEQGFRTALDELIDEISENSALSLMSNW